jgi:hypothetical protein
MFATRKRALPIPIPRQENGISGHKRTHSLSLTGRSEETGKEGSFLWMTNEKDYRYLIIVRTFHRLTHPGQDRGGRWRPHSFTDGPLRRG